MADNQLMKPVRFVPDPRGFWDRVFNRNNIPLPEAVVPLAHVSAAFSATLEHGLGITPEQAHAKVSQKSNDLATGAATCHTDAKRIRGQADRTFQQTVQTASLIRDNELINAQNLDDKAREDELISAHLSVVAGLLPQKQK